MVRSWDDAAIAFGVIYEASTVVGGLELGPTDSEKCGFVDTGFISIRSVARRIGFSLRGQETFCFSKSGLNRFDRQATSASKFWTPLRALRICGHCPVSLPGTSKLDLSRPSA
jgi:hypothetical protein